MLQILKKIILEEIMPAPPHPIKEGEGEVDNPTENPDGNLNVSSPYYLEIVVTDVQGDEIN